MSKARRPNLRRLLWHAVYEFLARTMKHEEWTFMNYGYAPVQPGDVDLKLDGGDEPDRYHIQLYHHVAGAVGLHGMDVLEVGSGRGGGAAYICRALGPKSVTGLDLAGAAVALSRKLHTDPQLRFVQGSSDEMPFDDESFDAVVNVESSHCYGPLERFLSEVHRVLRPGGRLLFADFRSRAEIDALRNELKASGLALVSETVITPNVFRSLELDNRRKLELIERFGAPVRRYFDRFAALQGTDMFEAFRTGENEYISCVLAKP